MKKKLFLGVIIIFMLVVIIGCEKKEDKTTNEENVNIFDIDEGVRVVDDGSGIDGRVDLSEGN